MPSFLQSPEWQEIQERMGRPTRRIQGALLVRHDIFSGLRYWYAPRPAALSKDFFLAAERIARESQAIFLKIDPVEHLKIENCPPAWTSSKRSRAGKLKIVPAPSLQPRSTVVLDCRKSDDELLGAMHPKTRYNIRLAERRGVIIRRIPAPVAPADFQTFHRLLAITAGREGFSLHPHEHYRILVDMASGDFSNEIFVAEYAGQPIAAALVNWYAPEKTATYLHGGSSRERQNLMAPHLLHWRIIQHVRERGFDVYDFGGIDDTRWPGLSRFKSGFGGERREYPSSADYVFRPWPYALYRLQRRLRHASS